jgi:hypothetical protein
LTSLISHISKEIEESEAEISKLQEKVERLKNEQLNIALTELEKDELIRKAAKVVFNFLNLAKLSTDVSNYIANLAVFRL